MSEHTKQLSIPPGATNAQQAQELLRFWVADNQDHAQVFIGAADDPKKEPFMWGFILADTFKHVVSAIRESNPEGPGAQRVAEEMMDAFIDRLKANPQLSSLVTKATEE